MINKHYKSLCIKEITGNITGMEKQALDNWLSESSENKNEYEKLKETWIVSNINELPPSIDIDMEWTKLNNKLINFDRDDIKETIFQKLFSPNPIPKLAAVLAGIFIICIVVLGIYLSNRDLVKSQLIIEKTSNNEYKNIKLPDGSTVYLNSGSSIKFLVRSEGEKKTFFNGERDVILNGEAFFSVTRNKIPFVITTENAKITVLGTKFDVLSRDESTRVVVKEGKVNFSSKNLNSDGIYLTKDQLSSITKNSEPTPAKEVDAGFFLGWMKGNLVFYRTPIGQIANDLERHYNINISLQEDSLKDYSLTGSFNNNNADSAVSMICLALGLDFEKQNNIYIIKTKNITK
jgi:transmembrane sensor